MLNTDLKFKIDFFLGNSPKDMSFTDLLGGASYDTLLGTLPGGETHANVVGICKATGPAGTYYANAGFGTNSFVSPDTAGSMDDWVKSSVSLPLSGSEVLCGNYTFDYNIRVNVLSALVGYNASGYFEVTGDYTSLIGATPTGLSIQVYGGTHSGTYLITSCTYDSGTGFTRVVVTGPPSAFTSDVSEYCGIIFGTTNTENYCYERPAPNIDTDSSCIFSTLTATDSSTYVAVFGSSSITPAITLAWSISPPTTYSATPVTGSGNPFVIGYGTSVLSGANIWTGAYAVQLTSTLVYNVDTWGAYTWFVVHDSIVSSKTHTVKCDTCFCDIKPCIDNLYAKYVEALGKNLTRVDELRTKIIKVNYNWMLYQMAERCGESYTEYCAEIAAIILSENCQCQISDTTVSVEVVPLALQAIPSVSGCDITFGTGAAGLPVTPTIGDTHFFTTTSGLFNAYDVYWYNGSAWAYQYNIKGATGAAGAAGTNGASGADGTTVLFCDDNGDSATTTSYTLFANKTYAVTALTATGDEILVEGIFYTNAIAKTPDMFKFMLDGLDIPFAQLPTIGGAIIQNGFYGKIFTIVITMKIHVMDFSTKKLGIMYEAQYLDNYANELSTGVVKTLLTTTNALTSLSVAAYGKIGATGTVTCNSMKIKLFNK
jgi:hypothetical protein